MMTDLYFQDPLQQHPRLDYSGHRNLLATLRHPHPRLLLEVAYLEVVTSLENLLPHLVFSYPVLLLAQLYRILGTTGLGLFGAAKPDDKKDEPKGKSKS